jgi:hypothetical protein
MTNQWVDELSGGDHGSVLLSLMTQQIVAARKAFEVIATMERAVKCVLSR